MGGLRLELRSALLKPVPKTTGAECMPPVPVGHSTCVDVARARQSSQVSQLLHCKLEFTGVSVSALAAPGGETLLNMMQSAGMAVPMEPISLALDFCAVACATETCCAAMSTAITCPAHARRGSKAIMKTMSKARMGE